MQRDLAAAITHDLKNALSVISGRLEQLAAELPTDSAQHRQVALTAHEVGLLRHRLVAFLTLYKGETLKPVVADQSPVRFIHRVADELLLPRDRSLVVHVETHPDTPAYAFFDAHLVALVLEAAVHNACRFTRSRIRLGVEPRAGALVFYVQDDGPGLGTAEPGAPSTGLGMRLAEVIAHAHTNKGRRGWASLVNARGGGARFEIGLP